MHFDRDVTGIGAINVDHLAGPSASSALREAGLTWETGTEHHVDAATIETAINAVGANRLTTTIGGSALNTVLAIACTGAPLRLGFVGVAGRTPVTGLPRDVDQRLVFRDERRLSGTCFSFSADGERTLLTHAGANDHFVEHLDRHFGALVAYLAATRIVHVTSFLDDHTAPRLSALLSAVKGANSEARISFDPGHVWSLSAATAIREIAALADYVLVNRREQTNLNPDPRRAVVKHPDGVEAGGRFFPHKPLPAAEIVDDTGAGDVFAAGFLTVLARRPDRLDLACDLGLRMARHKLQHRGVALPGFADLLGRA
ncbi:PfkB family carbohydrate kinase [Actinoplanes sp. HUAS TT8]|uniref:PfkB family carbohydrate kinase n=1 Tax=Actinoplanes sp. HUAS TT8 TaxID=3447453 RepID=UPI003F51DFFB